MAQQLLDTCDSCGKNIYVGDVVYNVGDSMEVILYCGPCGVDYKNRENV